MLSSGIAPLSVAGWSQWRFGRGRAGLGRPPSQPGSGAGCVWTNTTFKSGGCSTYVVAHTRNDEITARKLRENPKFMDTATGRRRSQKTDIPLPDPQDHD